MVNTPPPILHVDMDAFYGSGEQLLAWPKSWHFVSIKSVPKSET
jgi:hypothetical protein